MLHACSTQEQYPVDALSLLEHCRDYTMLPLTLNTHCFLLLSFFDPDFFFPVLSTHSCSFFFHSFVHLAQWLILYDFCSSSPLSLSLSLSPSLTQHSLAHLSFVSCSDSQQSGSLAPRGSHNPYTLFEVLWLSPAQLLLGWVQLFSPAEGPGLGATAASPLRVSVTARLWWIREEKDLQALLIFSFLLRLFYRTLRFLTAQTLMLYSFSHDYKCAKEAAFIQCKFKLRLENT